MQICLVEIHLIWLNIYKLYSFNSLDADFVNIKLKWSEYYMNMNKSRVFNCMSLQLETDQSADSRKTSVE